MTNNPSRRPRIRPSAEWLRDQYEVQGRDCVQISKDLGIDGKTAWKWVRAAGIETRKRGFGHPQNYFVKGQCGGELNAHFGHRHSAEVRAIVGKASRDRGAVPYLRNGVHYLQGQPASNNPNWRGGITPERQAFYRTPEWKECVKIVWRRDDAICRHCQLDFRTVDRQIISFDLHHVDSFSIVERRADPDNVVLLCETCHYWTHSRANTARLFLGEGQR